MDIFPRNLSRNIRMSRLFMLMDLFQMNRRKNVRLNRIHSIDNTIEIEIKEILLNLRSQKKKFMKKERGIKNLIHKIKRTEENAKIKIRSYKKKS